MRIVLILWALVVLLAAQRAEAAGGAGPEDSKAVALRAFEAGMAHYQKEEYVQAITDFEAGYRLVPQPVFLYNIGQSYRLSNQPQKAIDYYRRYLREDPGARNFNEVQDRINALEKQLGEDRTRTSPEPPPAAVPEPPPAALLTDVRSAPATVAPRAARPRRKVWPIVLGVVGGAVVVGAAVGLGVYFGTMKGGDAPPIWSPVTP